MRAPNWLLTIVRMVRLQNAMMVLCAVLVSEEPLACPHVDDREFENTLWLSFENVQNGVNGVALV